MIRNNSISLLINHWLQFPPIWARLLREGVGVMQVAMAALMTQLLFQWLAISSTASARPFKKALVYSNVQFTRQCVTQKITKQKTPRLLFFIGASTIVCLSACLSEVKAGGSADCKYVCETNTTWTKPHLCSFFRQTDACASSIGLGWEGARAVAVARGLDI